MKSSTLPFYNGPSLRQRLKAKWNTFREKEKRGHSHPHDQQHHHNEHDLYSRSHPNDEDEEEDDKNEDGNHDDDDEEEEEEQQEEVDEERDDEVEQEVGADDLYDALSQPSSSSTHASRDDDDDDDIANDDDDDACAPSSSTPSSSASSSHRFHSNSSSSSSSSFLRPVSSLLPIARLSVEISEGRHIFKDIPRLVPIRTFVKVNVSGHNYNDVSTISNPLSPKHENTNTTTTSNNNNTNNNEDDGSCSSPDIRVTPMMKGPNPKFRSHFDNLSIYDITETVCFQLIRARRLRKNECIGQVFVPLTMLTSLSPSSTSSSSSSSPLSSSSSSSSSYPTFDLQSWFEVYPSPHEFHTAEGLFANRWPTAENGIPNTGLTRPSRCLGFLHLSLRLQLTVPLFTAYCTHRSTMLHHVKPKRFHKPTFKRHVKRFKRAVKFKPAWVSYWRDLCSWHHPFLSMFVQLFFVYLCFYAPPAHYPFVVFALIGLAGTASYLACHTPPLSPYYSVETLLLSTDSNFERKTRTRIAMTTATSCTNQKKSSRIASPSPSAKTVVTLSTNSSSSSLSSSLSSSSPSIAATSSSRTRSPFLVSKKQVVLSPPLLPSASAPAASVSSSSISSPSLTFLEAKWSSFPPLYLQNVYAAPMPVSHLHSFSDEAVPYEWMGEGLKHKVQRYTLMIAIIAYYIGMAVSYYDRLTNAFNFTDRYISFIAYSSLFVVCLVVSLLLRVLGANVCVFLVLTGLLCKRLPRRFTEWLNEGRPSSTSSASSSSSSSSSLKPRSSSLSKWKMIVKKKVSMLKIAVVAFVSRIPDEFELGHRIICQRAMLHDKEPDPNKCAAQMKKVWMKGVKDELDKKKEDNDAEIEVDDDDEEEEIPAVPSIATRPRSS